jgi:hypothetical protein
MTEYEIRDAGGVLQAIHIRRDTPTGKLMSWRSPDGTNNLGGRRADSLPLYGSQNVVGWDRDTWIIVTEGESDRDALTALDVPALGTVIGAASHPTVDALRDIANVRKFVLWPDNDDAGRAHMLMVGANLYRAGAVSVFTMVYSPTIAAWPKGAGARDLIGNAEPIPGAALVSWMVEEWAEHILRPGPAQVSRPAPQREMGDTGSVSDALIARGVLNARPGRTVRCPAHEDRRASLSILRDDRRAICKAASCPWSGRGVIAADILSMVSA